MTKGQGGCYGDKAILEVVHIMLFLQIQQAGLKVIEVLCLDADFLCVTMSSRLAI